MAEIANSGIYEIVNLVDLNRYIGSAKWLSIRRRQHWASLKKGAHHNIKLQRSWNKYGERNFQFRVLVRCRPQDLLLYEQIAIDALSPGLNICQTAGSTLGRRHSEETRGKISLRKMGSKLPPRSDEHRQKLSKSLAGRAKSDDHFAKFQQGRADRVFTADQKDKVSRSLKAAYQEGRHRRDRPPEYRYKIAESLRKNARDPEVRKKLRKQASDAWKRLSEEDRCAKMEEVRAARKPLSAEQRRQISERQLGRPMHPNAVKALANANTGRKLSVEHRKKLSESFSKSWTAERKAKQSAALKAYHQRKKEMVHSH